MKQAQVGPGRPKGKLLPGVGAGKGPQTAQGRKKTKDEGRRFQTENALGTEGSLRHLRCGAPRGGSPEQHEWGGGPA